MVLPNHQKPDIILFMTDQQRFDTIGALGYPYMITPNLDRLVKEGTTFTHTYCTSPACVPSRASFFNLKYPHEIGVYHNFCLWENSWVEKLQKAGNRTVNIGKMHTVPHDARCGFDQRFIVENKIRPLQEDAPHGGFYDQWDMMLADNRRERPSKAYYRETCPDFAEAAGAFAWRDEERFHADVFTADRAKWFLQKPRSDNPLFLQIGFPGPHPPYDPPTRFIELYRDTKFPVVPFTRKEKEAQPKAQDLYRQGMIDHQRDGAAWQEHLLPDQRQRLWRHYAANITLIDEKIGEIMDLLEKCERLDNTVILFTSDHGDCLGDHGHIQKWTMYEPVVRVPAIFWGPGLIPAGRQNDGMVQHFDLAAILLELAGTDRENDQRAEDGSVLPEVNIADTFDISRDYVYAEHSRDHILEGTRYMTMIRDPRYKLVHYLGDAYGELYDTKEDPDEILNLWDNSCLADVKSRLIGKLLNWRLEEDFRNSKRFHRDQ